ncbi:hypothetical protein ACIQPR_48785 [Streptomyces sp. NPDC091280]|uniref:hypothetical protein n=1 Tax=Streptomyces sp. NPDC091280 TaxID=3365984 RepID=UPI003821B1F7
MASSEKTTPWVDSFLDPDAEMERRLSASGGMMATVLTEAGRMWDAVVIAPLERGLAALDSLGLPLDSGYGVYADYRRHELIVHVAPGAAGTDERVDVQGVRALSRGSWVVMPRSGYGTWEAACLSGPTGRFPRYVDPAELRAAVLAVDEERAARTCAP